MLILQVNYSMPHFPSFTIPGSLTLEDLEDPGYSSPSVLQNLSIPYLLSAGVCVLAFGFLGSFLYSSANQEEGLRQLSGFPSSGEGSNAKMLHPTYWVALIQRLNMKEKE